MLQFVDHRSLQVGRTPVFGIAREHNQRAPDTARHGRRDLLVEQNIDGLTDTRFCPQACSQNLTLLPEHACSPDSSKPPEGPYQRDQEN
jgi:hypothetical protein